MSGKLPILAVAAFAFGLQFGVPEIVWADQEPVIVPATYKCKRTTTCTWAFPDISDVECVAGTLKECKEWSDSDGCIHCSASTSTAN